MSDTFGLTSTNLSPSASLQRSLGNRLHQKMDVNGSLEYALTWKQWDMLSGVPICALRARARRISDNDYSGWPTPQNRATAGGDYADPEKALARLTSGHQINLADVALVSGWATPQARDHFPAHSPEYIAAKKAEGHGMANLNDQVMLTGWATPSSRDWKDSPGMATTGINPDGTVRNRTDQLPCQAALVSGETSISSPAVTEKPGALNPEFVRWLMGFPPEWGSCAPTATR